MTYSFIDVHGLGGGLSLGLEHAGISMLHRAGLSFGAKNVLANRDHFRHDFSYEHSDNNDAHNWSADFTDVDVVAAVPPCSGFSPLSSKNYRGMDSPANACMWSGVRYAGRIAPQVYAFESVMQAFSQGRELMQALRDELELLSGKQYFLYHYKHNGLAVGGSAIRARYMFIASQVPFGVTPTAVERVPSILDSIGDLANLELQWSAQPYRRPATWWSEEYRSADGRVDGHITRDSTHARRMDDLLQTIHWEPGKDEAWAIQESWNKLERQLPESFENIREKVETKLREAEEREAQVNLGFNGTIRWRPTRPAFVTTGDAANKIVHPTRPRLLTARELYRIQGFPDDWKLKPLQRDSKMWTYPGKGVNVKVGEHLGHEIINALNGTPGEDQGELIGDREFLIDHSRLHKPALTRLLEETEGV